MKTKARRGYIIGLKFVLTKDNCGLTYISKAVQLCCLLYTSDAADDRYKV